MGGVMRIEDDRLFMAALLLCAFVGGTAGVLFALWVAS